MLNCADWFCVVPCQCISMLKLFLVLMCSRVGFKLHRYVSPILGIHFCWGFILYQVMTQPAPKRLFVGPSSCANHPKPQIHPVDICWWLIMARFFGGVLWFNMTGMTGNGDGEIWPISTAVHAVYSGEVMTGPQISPQHARELATINRSMHILGSCLQLLKLVKSHVTGQRTCSYWHCKWFLIFCTIPCGPSMSPMSRCHWNHLMYILVYVRLILFIFSFHTRAVGCKERNHFCIASKPRTLSKPPVYKRGIEVDRHVPYRDSTLTLLLLAGFINSQLRPEDGLGWSIAFVFFGEWSNF